MTKVTYLKTAVHEIDFPMANRPEIALAGRSNAGKSSFLNAVSKQDVAHVSSMPGKTQTLNFFDVGMHYRIVDMPGYGYANRGQKEVKFWRGMVENYLIGRESLVGVILFMDSRRTWESEEEMLRRWLAVQGLPLVVAMTKSDKLLEREVRSGQNKLKSLGLVAIPISSLKGAGLKELEDYVFKTWVKPVLEEVKS